MFFKTHFLGSASYLSSVEYLNLICCVSCVLLPPIGQLPNLKYLKILGATAIKNIGPEFVGCGIDNPRSAEAVAFPKLEILVIEDMPNWEEWTIVAEEEIKEATIGANLGEVRAARRQVRDAPTPNMCLLPRLKRLELVCCPKLRILPQQFGQDATSLEVLDLRASGSLKVVENFTYLSEVRLMAGCEGLEKVSSLPQVRATGCPRLSCVQRLDNLQQLWLDEGMQEISSLWLLVFKRGDNCFMVTIWMSILGHDEGI